MRHGGLVRVTGDAFYLSPDLHRPLFIDTGSRAWGFYHPPASMEKHRDGYNLRAPDPEEARVFSYDFVFTAIPPRLWPTVARLEIYISHRNGALADIARFLSLRNINILYGECSREARTHAVFTLIVDFTDLHDQAKLVNVENDQSVTHTDPERLARDCNAAYEATRSALEQLVGRPTAYGGGWPVGDLRTEFPTDGGETSPIYWNYPESQSPDRSTPLAQPEHPAVAFSRANYSEGGAIPDRTFPPLAVDGQVLWELQYYHHRVAQRIRANGHGSVYRPFRVDCTDGSVFRLGNNGREILSNDVFVPNLPAYGVAVTVPEQAFIRVSMVPESEVRSFCRVEIGYTVHQSKAGGSGPSPTKEPVNEIEGGKKHAAPAPQVLVAAKGSEPSSRGLLATVAQKLRSDFGIWRVVNHTHRLRDPEQGRLVLLVRATSAPNPAEKLSETLRCIEHPHVTIERISVLPLAPFRVFVSFTQRWPRWPDFEAMIQEEGQAAGLRPDDVVIVKGAAGIPWVKVRDELATADAVLQVSVSVDQQGEASGWLDAEAFAAWCMRKPLVILADKTHILRQRPMVQGMMVEHLEALCTNAQAREAIRNALAFLIGEARKRPARGHER